MNFYFLVVKKLRKKIKTNLVHDFFFFFGHVMQLVGSLFTDQGFNPALDSESLES